jgi:hypothetical protein
MKAKNKTWIHVVLWGIMILYLFIAPPIKDKLTIVEGKPVAMSGVSLESAGIIRDSIDKFNEVKIGKQMLYRVIGWSFIENDVKQTDYDVYLVLNSENHTYFFPTVRGNRDDVEKAFPEIKADLSKSGFTALIAKDTMKNGEYRVGFLYKNKTSGETIYQSTEEHMLKTLNTIQPVE